MKGYKAMKYAEKNGTSGQVSIAIEAAVATVAAMENLGSFNCGYGSVLNENGIVEMDAMVMDGKDLRVGGVAALCKFLLPKEGALKYLGRTF